MRHRIATLGLCLLALVQGAHGQDQEKPDPAILTVRGDATLEKPADQLRVSIGVVTEHASASTAMAENAERMDDVVRAMRKAGLTEQEYETGRFSLQPQYSRRPRNAEPDWKAQIIGYRVTNELTVKTERIEMAGKLLEACTSAGANSINSISFTLADPRVHRAEAIATATRHARADAKVLADAAGQRLIRIRSISLDQADWRPPIPLAQRGGGAMAMAESMPPPIAPGDVTIRASVTIVYEIAPTE